MPTQLHKQTQKQLAIRLSAYHTDGIRYGADDCHFDIAICYTLQHHKHVNLLLFNLRHLLAFTIKLHPSLIDSRMFFRFMESYIEIHITNTQKAKQSILLYQYQRNSKSNLPHGYISRKLNLIIATERQIFAHV